MINKNIFLILVASFLIFSVTQAKNLDSQDPYAAVEHITLSNGMQVFLAPGPEASLMDIHLEVGVGTEAESGATIGVSHLLEHVLFRDKNLSDEMSYLQLIKEAGGSANGGTYNRKTTYFGSIPSEKGLWLLENFGKMILMPKFSDDYVQKEKGTIELERGRPSPIEQTLGFNFMSLMYPKHLKKRDFWKSEFNYEAPKSYSLLEEQLSTQRLTTKQVEDHYLNYYYPSNMKLFISGKFNKEAILKEVHSTWANVADKKGETLKPEPDLVPRHAPYIRNLVSTTPNVQLGFKISNADQDAVYVLNSYTSYLAHRMMKDIRNSKGQTYTAYESNYLYKGSGYVSVSFVTPKESFKENLKLAESYFEHATQGILTSEQVKEAIALEISSYNLRGKESAALMQTAQEYADKIHQYGEFVSPYTTLKNMTPEKYNETLKVYFNPQMSYEILNNPPLIFHYDRFLLYGVAFVLIFMGLRYFLTQEFHNDKVQWIRKVQYPPLKLVEGFALVVVWFLYLHVQYLLDMVFESDLMQSSIITSEYLPVVATVIAFICVAQGVYSFMPRKLMIHKQDLLIKSITYFSNSIPLQDIVKVEAVRPLFYPFPLSRWLQAVKYRYFFMTPMFWKKGLLVTTNNGKAYFFSVKDAVKAKTELDSFLNTANIDKSESLAA